MELTIERAALKAWPAGETIETGAWILRFDTGYTKRANSVTVLGAPPADLPREIATCEALYRERGLPPVFRLPSFAAPGPLDTLLDRMGYQRKDPTRVMQKTLEGWTPSGEAVSEEGPDAWLSLFEQITDAAPENRARHLKILKRIDKPALFAVRRESGRVVSCGMGVLSDGYFGIFNLATAPGYRRSGHGIGLLSEMLAWAVEKGASQAYLQVTHDNPGALALYGQAGFTARYDYWYRVRE